ncbi:hypothetical protein AMJ71_04695 [candidate division TA06 bacterium SM1_40]|uniref:Flippase-like domain-containing protein n=2 Tax=Bacteria division TA06 TaxID=1156500 RepID=A0A0S8JMH1_UNCT6|nr:MAG: hypothetical protein AMJ82_00985 [candidate division TA06 bacterium SM23_40]KPL10028.1 MAG: hypothetical protein AMJ71_04695 [candidate division TA06 bacterium SM1_40]
MRKWLWLFVRLIVSAGLLAFLLSRIDLARLVELVRGADVRFLALPFISLVGFIIIAAFRWRILLRSLEKRVVMRRLVAYYFVGLFFNNFFPTTVGGDALRGYYLSREGSAKSEAFASVFVERLSGIAALLILALVASALIYASMGDRTIILWVSLGFAIAGTLTLLLFSVSVGAAIERGLARVTIFGSGAKLTRFLRALRFYRGQKRAVVAAVVISCIIQSIHIYANYLVGRALGLEVPPQYYFLFVPIITVAAMLPLTINGVGIRENAFVLLFGRVGMGAAEATSVSLLIFGTWVVVSLIGGVIFLFGPATWRVAPEPGTPQRP